VEVRTDVSEDEVDLEGRVGVVGAHGGHAVAHLLEDTL
jgi:hypothetical protein